jgi:hypothetical protein
MHSAWTVLYCRLWPVWLYHIFPHHVINGTTFGKTLFKKKCVFWFSKQFCPSSSYSKKSPARYYHVGRFSCNSRYSWQILMKLKFSRQSLKKYSNIKYHENPSSGEQSSMRTDRRTARQTGVTKIIVAIHILRRRLITSRFWPLRFPDLNPRLYYLWGTLQDSVNVKNLLSLQERKDNIRRLSGYIFCTLRHLLRRCKSTLVNSCKEGYRYYKISFLELNDTRKITSKFSAVRGFIDSRNTQTI